MDGTVPKANPPQTEMLRLQVDAYDIADLREFLVDAPEMKVVEDRPPEAHGEPVTVAVLIIAPIVIQAISLWALKQRRKKSLEIRGEKVRPDGSRESISVKVRMNESTSSRDVVEQVVQGMGLDPSLIEAATALGN